MTTYDVAATTPATPSAPTPLPDGHPGPPARRGDERPGDHPDTPDEPDEPPGTDQPDDVLVERSALGDQSAFAALVARHGAALYRYARRLLPSAQDAEDAVQDALTAAWLGADAYRGDASVRTWLFGIQTNCVRRAARRRARTAVPVDVRDDDAPPSTGAAPVGDPVGHLLAVDLRAALDGALAALPASQRAVWLLVEVEGMSYADAASVLRTTHAAVRGSLARARQSLSRRFSTWR
ncbi:RNA polymerase sigma factor [Cellulomonas wangsupingiae]|uniref:RNA polymerase sigma factor n=1 Tax=Cellulomonas wangsupingiae TaxID=2968085 RepID=UPI002030AFED|nr:RNA polymerase sigma factor [Cellulomonas wangsupingiae]MCM0638760.1 RNA polymerase sigma factor [Cellulomonas wangsupingiae]